MAKCKVVLNCPLWIKQPSRLSVIHFKSLQNTAWTREQILKLYWDNYNMSYSCFLWECAGAESLFSALSAESWWEWALSWTVDDVGSTIVSMSVLGLRVTAQTKFGCFGHLEVMKCSADCRRTVPFSLKLDVLLPIFTFQDLDSKFPLWSPVRPMLQTACYLKIWIKLICLHCDWKPETRHKAAAENR